jgi:hypothetical protein
MLLGEISDLFSSRKVAKLAEKKVDKFAVKKLCGFA